MIQDCIGGRSDTARHARCLTNLETLRNKPVVLEHVCIADSDVTCM